MTFSEVVTVSGIEASRNCVTKSMRIVRRYRGHVLMTSSGANSSAMGMIIFWNARR